jgi:hypothetical protein
MAMACLMGTPARFSLAMLALAIFRFCFFVAPFRGLIKGI